MLKLICDRCDKEGPAKIHGVFRESNPYANAAIPLEIPAEVKLPPEWNQVDGKHLCDRCTRELADFLRPIPKAMPVSIR